MNTTTLLKKDDNGNIETTSIRELNKLYPLVSFPKLDMFSDDLLVEFDVYLGELTIPDPTRSIVDVETTEWELVHGRRYIQKRTYTSKINTISAEEILRELRDYKLYMSDYTHTTDSTKEVTNKEAWTTYRQELRDLPANTPDPENVTWPKSPDGKLI
mgnify:FL=1|jgi:hypothetical protein